MLKRIFILFLVLKCSSVFSQDSIPGKYRHTVGAEVLGTVGGKRSEGHFSAGTNYKPGFSLFYRLHNRNKFGFESRLFYRSGFGSTKDGGKGGYSVYSGDFNILRMDVGLLFSSKQNDKPENFEFGFKFGHTLYQEGKIKLSGYGYGIYHESEVSTSSVLNPYYFGVHFGANFTFKSTETQGIVGGCRVYFETRDFKYTGMNFTGGLFLAYKFQ